MKGTREQQVAITTTALMMMPDVFEEAAERHKLLIDDSAADLGAEADREIEALMDEIETAIKRKSA